MLPSLLLSLREGLEAALIIGIVLGVLNKIHRKDQFATVWRGVGVAVILSLLAAIILLGVGGELDGRAEEIYEGIAMLSAAILLTWMIFWMQKQSGSIKGEIEYNIRIAISKNSNRAIFLLAFLAIGREGFELALFMTASSAATGIGNTIIGTIIGLGIALCLGYILFTTTKRLNIKSFFLVTNILLILFASGLVAHGIHELNEALLIPPIIEHVWDTNHLIDENSSIGLLLKTLFGYNGNPSLAEVAAYIAYLFIILILFWRNLQPRQLSSSPTA